jgi:NADH:ubiquinone oxidoreductase subunit F (NADH-binding)
MLSGWTKGESSPSDLGLLDELADALRLTSICGLGQVVPAPIASVLKHFREEIDSHLLHRHCPAGVCARKAPVQERFTVKLGRA